MPLLTDLQCAPLILISSSTYIHIFHGLPRRPVTLKSNALLSTRSSSLLKICPYQCTPFALANISTVCGKPNIPISSSVIVLSINLTPHIALPVLLSVLLKIAISFTLKRHVSLPYNSAGLTQLSKNFPFIFSGNLRPLSNSPHSLNFIQPTRALAVTAASHPPLTFTVSTK